MKKVRIGVIGCGKISGAYLGMARNFPVIEVAGVSDLNLDAAKAKAAEFKIQKVCTVEEMFKDDSIELILNLTVPKVHAQIALAAIKAGKHTYSEKPFALNREEGKRILAAARRKKVLVGCAPDTFLGAGIQTARKLLDDGVIGKPVAFTAFMLCPGHESWHPSPEFYYEVGGGPMFDMGPYYLTALLNLLGPVQRYSGMAGVAIPERTITSQPKFGKKVKVETPDHVLGNIEFANGCSGSILTSFATRFPSYDGAQPITIYGTEGTLRVPDPNGFDGRVHYRKKNDDDWRWQEHTFVKGYGRAVGIADMAYAIRTGRKFRASGELAFAVLDLMQGFLESSDQGRTLKPTAKFERPNPMRADLPFGTLEE